MCLICMAPWVLTPALPKKKKKNQIRKTLTFGCTAYTLKSAQNPVDVIWFMHTCYYLKLTPRVLDTVLGNLCSTFSQSRAC